MSDVRAWLDAHYPGAPPSLKDEAASIITAWQHGKIVFRVRARRSGKRTVVEMCEAWGLAHVGSSSVS